MTARLTTNVAVHGPPCRRRKAISQQNTILACLRMTSGCAKLKSQTRPSPSRSRPVASEWRYDHILASTWHPRSRRDDARTLAAVQCLFHAGLALELAQWDMRARQANILTILQRQRKPGQLPGVIPCKVAVGLALIGLGLTCTPKWSLRPAATTFKPCVTSRVHTGSLCSGQAGDLRARTRAGHFQEHREQVPKSTRRPPQMRTTRWLFNGAIGFASLRSI